MNWLDVLLVLPLLVGLVMGLIRGFISEIIAVVVVILGVLGAKLGAGAFSGFLLTHFAWPQGVCDVVAYTLLFLTIAIVLAIAAKLINKLLKTIHLSWLNRIAGGLFGLCKYGIFVLLAVFVMDRTDDAFHWTEKAPIVQQSVTYPYMVKATHVLLSFSRSEHREP
jgi:membrane protein required for colicin V production